MNIQGIFDRKRDARARYGGILPCDRYKGADGEVFLTIANDFLLGALELKTLRADKTLKAMNYRGGEVLGWYPVFVQRAELDALGIDYDK